MVPGWRLVWSCLGRSPGVEGRQAGLGLQGLVHNAHRLRDRHSRAVWSMETRGYFGEYMRRLVSCAGVRMEQAGRPEGPPRLRTGALRRGVRMEKGSMDAHTRARVWHTARSENCVSRATTRDGVAYQVWVLYP